MATKKTTKKTTKTKDAKKKVEISIATETLVVTDLKIEVTDNGWYCNGRAVSKEFSLILDSICFLTCEKCDAAADLLHLMENKMGLNFDDENGYSKDAEASLVGLITKVRESFTWKVKPWANGRK